MFSNDFVQGRKNNDNVDDCYDDDDDDDDDNVDDCYDDDDDEAKKFRMVLKSMVEQWGQRFEGKEMAAVKTWRKKWKDPLIFIWLGETKTNALTFDRLDNRSSASVRNVK